MVCEYPEQTAPTTPTTILTTTPTTTATTTTETTQGKSAEKQQMKVTMGGDGQIELRAEQIVVRVRLSNIIQSQPVEITIMTRSKLIEVSWGRIGGELVENWLRIG